MKNFIFPTLFVVFILAICLDGINAIGELPKIDENTDAEFNGPPPASPRLSASKSSKDLGSSAKSANNLESSHTAASEGSTASERPSVKDRIVVFDNTKAERSKSAVIEALRQTEDAPVLIESIQPKEPVSAVESSGENKDVVKSEVPKDAKHRQMVAPANHNGVQESTFGGTAHSNAGTTRDMTLMAQRGNFLDYNKSLLVIEGDTYYLPIIFLPASFNGPVDIRLEFLKYEKDHENVMKPVIKPMKPVIKPGTDGMLYAEVPMEQCAIKDHLGNWKTTELNVNRPRIHKVVIEIAKLGKKLTVSNVEIGKSLVVRTDIVEDKDKVHIIDKFDEQLIHLYDATRIEKHIDTLNAKLDAIEVSVPLKLEKMREDMLGIVRRHLDASRLAVQKEITQHSEVSAKNVEEGKTKIVDGNTLLDKHFKEIGNVEKKIQGEVQDIGNKMKDIEKKIGDLKRTETSQLDGIKTGTNQHIDGEYANEKKHIETEILQPIKKLQREIVALNGAQDNSFKAANVKVSDLLTKEEATKAQMEEMRKIFTAFVNEVKKMGLFVNNEVDKRVDQLEPNMKNNFEKYMGNPETVKINGVELKTANVIMAFLLVNMANILKFHQLPVPLRSVSVPVH